MAMLKPAWMQANLGDSAIEYSAQDDRRVLRALFSREGVNNYLGGHLKVSQRGAGANFSVDIASGECAIFGDDVSDQGAYQCTSTAVENRNTFSTGGSITAPGSGSRTHRVIARIKDKKHAGSWTVYDWAIEILQDTGSGTPAVPNSAIPLGRFTIAAGQSSITNANIIDDRQPWSIGTPARTGTFSPISAYAASQAPRLPSYHINPDGWVSLGGWVVRTAGNANIVYNPPAPYELFPAGSLPADVAPLGAVRDISITAAWGPIHGVVELDGRIRFRPFADKLLLTGDWFSLDSCGYRR